MRFVVVLLLGAISLAAQQSQQPVIRSRVTMVPLDVRVIDKDGKPITDLKPEEFVVTEDGVRQAIAHFSSQGLVAQPEMASAPLEFASDAGVGASTAPAVSNRRVLFIVLSRGRHQAFKHANALADFIGTQLMPQDVVALTAWNRTTDFSTDHPRMRDVAIRYAERHERIETMIREWASGLRARVRATRVLPEYIQKEIDWVFEPAAHVRQVPPPSGHPGLADFMRRSMPAHVYGDTARMLVGLNYMRFLAGEKRIVYLTEFGSGILRPRENKRDIGARAADSRVALDVIQTGGTIGAPPASFVGPMSNRQISMPNMPSSDALADFMWSLRDIRETAANTGGLGSTLKKGNEAFAALAAVTGFQYLLAYYPSNSAMDGAYRNVKVTVLRPGARVLVRDGYFAGARTEALDLRDYETATRIQEARTNRRPMDGIRLEVTNLTRPTPLQLEAEVRVKLESVTAGDENGLRIAAVDMAVVATDDQRKQVGEMTRRVDLKVLPARWEQMGKDGLVVSLRITLDRPAKELKVIAYDYASGNLGSTIVQVR